MGNNWGGIRNKICDTVSFPFEPYCNTGWEYHDGNLSKWQSDTTLRIICQGKLIATFVFSKSLN